MSAERGLRILVIEDDPDAQANMRDILELDGHQVDVAGSIAAALDRTNWSEFRVIFLDRRLGDGTSDQLLPRLRMLAPRAAAIVVTGYGDLDSTIAALREGAWDYILKPVNPDALRASLSRIMQMQHAEERALHSERLAAVGEMTAILIHESRNALLNSTAAIELLRRRLQDRPEAIELIERVVRAQSRIERLFQDVREYAAPIVLIREPTAIGDVLSAAWEELQPVWASRNVRFVLRSGAVALWSPETATASPWVNGFVVSLDRERVQQLLRNVFENALAAAKDPVELCVGVSESALFGQAGLLVTVRDNGPGLSREQLQRVFDPFFTTKPKGTGLGMAIARRIVEAHGGHLEAASPGGAEFRIFLPW